MIDGRNWARWYRGSRNSAPWELQVGCHGRAIPAAIESRQTQPQGPAWKDNRPGWREMAGRWFVRRDPPKRVGGSARAAPDFWFDPCRASDTALVEPASRRNSAFRRRTNKRP